MTENNLLITKGKSLLDLKLSILFSVTIGIIIFVALGGLSVFTINDFTSKFLVITCSICFYGGISSIIAGFLSNRKEPFFIGLFLWFVYIGFYMMLCQYLEFLPDLIHLFFCLR